MSFIPSWDDLDEGLPTENPPKKLTIEEKAAESISKLDTTEALKEFAAQAPTVNPNAGMVTKVFATDPEDIGIESGSMAKRVIDGLVAVRDTYDIGNAPSVSDKRLINSKSDLNQLVPFKYGWAWNAYLISASQHWMPAEYSVANSKDIFEAMSPDKQRFIYRIYTAYQTSKLAFSEKALLNCYKHITNPECRQYILGQGIESGLIHHVMMDLSGTFGLADKHELLKDSDEFIKDRMPKQVRDLHAILSPFYDPLFTTAGTENTMRFLDKLTIAYCLVTCIIPIISYYQALNAVGDTMPELNALLDKIIRDIRTQMEFAKDYIRTVTVEEKLNALDGNHHSIVFNNLLQVQFDLIERHHNYPNELNEIKEIVSLITHDFLSGAGADNIPQRLPRISDNANRFFNYYNSHKPELGAEATIGGSSLGW